MTSDEQVALTAFKSWGTQTIVHAMSMRAMDDGKDLGPDEMIGLATEAKRLLQEMWDSSFESEQGKPVHEALNAMVRRIFVWVGEHLSD